MNSNLGMDAGKSILQRLWSWYGFVHTRMRAFNTNHCNCVRIELVVMLVP